MRDDDDKVKSVVHDSLVSGDLDHAGFEAGLSPDLIVRWIALPTVWSFWRGGKQTKPSIEKALVTAYQSACSTGHGCSAPSRAAAAGSGGPTCSQRDSARRT